MNARTGLARWHAVIAGGSEREALAAIIREDAVFHSPVVHTPQQGKFITMGYLLAAAEWLAEMDRRGVPCSPINNYEEILSDPQVEALGLVRPLTLPNGVETRTTAFPVHMSGYEFAITRPVPGLGEHTVEVFDEWSSASPANEAARVPRFGRR